MWIGQLLSGDLGTLFTFGCTCCGDDCSAHGSFYCIKPEHHYRAVLIAVPLGILAAWRQGKTLDRLVMAISVMGFSVPVFVTAYVLILLFSIKLGWFPVQGYKPLFRRLLAFYSLDKLYPLLR